MMRNPPPLPDLTALSEAQKDELIVELWETLRAIDSTTDVTRGLDIPTSAAQALKSAAAQPSTNELRERIAKSAPSRRAQPPIAGSHWPHVSFAFLASTPVLAIVAMIGVGFLADFGIGWYQRRLVTARERATLELRNAAFSGLYVELTRIVYEPDGKSYRGTLAMQNFNPAASLYVMLDPARVFAQTGMSWQEVPSHSANEDTAQVYKLGGAKESSFVFQVNVKNWAELIPGYMHIRIQSDMLISQTSDPKDDIVARNTRFYVYLKPQDSDDAAIKRRGGFPGTPPIFIPMPPH
jgi:hypothetical protein